MCERERWDRVDRGEGAERESEREGRRGDKNRSSMLAQVMEDRGSDGEKGV